MKCKNCNAPIPPHTTRCVYCGSLNDLNLNVISDYTTEELDSGRMCPNCNIPMETIDIKLNGKFLIEHCNRCDGLFFDLNELEAILEAYINVNKSIDYSLINNLSNENYINHNEKIFYKKCPVCGKLMNRVSFGYRSGVIIDKCKDHGIYLDNGKLHALIQWVKAGGVLYDMERKIKDSEEEKSKLEYRNEYKSIMDFDGYSKIGVSADDDIFSTILSVIKKIF